MGWFRCCSSLESWRPTHRACYCFVSFFFQSPLEMLHLLVNVPLPRSQSRGSVDSGFFPSAQRNLSLSNSMAQTRVRTFLVSFFHTSARRQAHMSRCASEPCKYRKFVLGWTESGSCTPSGVIGHIEQECSCLVPRVL